MAKGQALEKILRSNSGPRREETVEVKRAESRLSRQHFQTRLLCVALVEGSNDFGNALVIVHNSSLPSLQASSHPILAASWILQSWRSAQSGSAMIFARRSLSSVSEILPSI